MSRPVKAAIPIFFASLLALAPPAFCQTALSSAMGPGSKERPSVLAEVIVTAEKRPEQLQTVPMTETVVQKHELRNLNITNVNELEIAVPELSTASGSLAIRGIGTQGVSRSAESAVGLVLDGVPVGRALLNSYSLFDIKQVEVLSGPQGILFGKNASAGLILITTNPPNPQKFEIIGHADLGFTHEYHVGRVTVNVPLSKDSAIRVSGYYDTHGDVYYNNFLHQASYNQTGGIRGRFLWTPNDRLTVNAIVDYEHSHDNGIESGSVGPIRSVLPGSPLAATLAACGVTPGPLNRTTCTDQPAPGAFSPTSTYGASLEVAYKWHGYKITSITAERQLHTSSLLYIGPGDDSDSVPTNVLDTNTRPAFEEARSEEIRLISPNIGRIKYVAGIFLSEWKTHTIENQAGTLGLLPPPLQTDRYWTQIINQPSYAAYGQATFKLNRQLSLIAGGRVTYETLSDHQYYRVLPGYIPIPAFGPTEAIFAHSVNKNFSWRLGMKYQLNRNEMAYFTVTRGYKGPMANDQAPGAKPMIILPEIPTDYELGLKSSLLHRRLAVDVDLFNERVRDFQTTVFIPPTATNPIPSFGEGNAPYVLTRGAKVTFFGEPIKGLSVNGGIIYNSATYSNNFIVACKIGSPAGCTTRSVSQLIFAPKWKATLSAEYTRSLSGKLQGFVEADWRYRSWINFSSTPDPNTVGPSHGVFGARIGIRTPDGRWSVAIFGRNLFNNVVPVSIGPDPLSAFNGGENGSYVQTFNIESFRLIGVSLGVRL